MSSAICTHCQTNLESDSLFCHICGEQVMAQQSPVKQPTLYPCEAEGKRAIKATGLIDPWGTTSAKRYPNLCGAGESLRSYGVVLKWIGGFAIVLSGIFLLAAMGGKDDSFYLMKLLGSVAGVVLGFLSIGAGIFSAAFGEAALALSDMAMSTERTAVNSRRTTSD